MPLLAASHGTVPWPRYLGRSRWHHTAPCGRHQTRTATPRRLRPSPTAMKATHRQQRPPLQLTRRRPARWCHLQTLLLVPCTSVSSPSQRGESTAVNFAFTGARTGLAPVPPESELRRPKTATACPCPFAAAASSSTPSRVDVTEGATPHAPCLTTEPPVPVPPPPQPRHRQMPWPPTVACTCRHRHTKIVCDHKCYCWPTPAPLAALTAWPTGARATSQHRGRPRPRQGSQR